MITWIAVIILPTLLLVIMPLINRIITPDTIYNTNRILDSIEMIFGSVNTTLLLAIIWIIMVMPIIRRFFSFFNGKK